MKPENLLARFQRIDWLRPSVVALIVSNLVPLAAVFLFHWDVFSLLFLFWLENVIIGIFNVAKMLTVGGILPIPVFDKAAQAQMASKSPGEIFRGLAAISLIEGGLKIFLTAFFCLHYGAFTVGHGILVVAMFGPHDSHDFLNLPMVFQIIQDNHLQWPLAALVASHLIAFGYDYLWCGEYRRTDLPTLMNQPYRRVIVMHLTIIFGGFLMMLLKSPLAGLAFLVCLKVIFDLHGHQKEREKFAAPKDGIVPDAPASVSGTPASNPETPSSASEMPGSIQSAIQARMNQASAPANPITGAKGVGVLILVLLFIFSVFGFIAWNVVSAFFIPFFSPHRATLPVASKPPVVAPAAPLTNGLWTLDLRQIQFRNREASGELHGGAFADNRAFYRNGRLNFHQGKGTNALDLSIFLRLSDDELAGKTFQIPRDAYGTNAIQINEVWRNGSGSTFTQPYYVGYAMKLEFGARKQNSVPSQIYLCLPDARQSYLVGNFRTIIRPVKTNAAGVN